MIGVEARDRQGGPEAAPGPRHPVRGLVAGLSRAVEPEVALARPPRPAGGEPGHRQAGHQRSGAHGLLAPDGIDHPERHGLRPAPRSVSVRPDAGQAPARRGRLSQRLRRRRPDPGPALHHASGRPWPTRWPRWAFARRVRSMERATFFESWRAKKLRASSWGPRRAWATPPRASRPSSSARAPMPTAGYPDIDDLFRQQAQERDRKKREALLHQIQRLMHERVMHAPDLRARHPARGRAAGRGARGRP